MTRRDRRARRRYVREAERRASETALSSPWHGPDHWRCVLEVGLALIGEGVPADRDVLLAFAAVHDTQRENDWDDPRHGPRAALLAADLYAEGYLDWLEDGQLRLLFRACDIHTEAPGSMQPTVAACLDADRLTLWRVGKTPDPAFLSSGQWVSESDLRGLSRYAYHRCAPGTPRSWRRLLRGW